MNLLHIEKILNILEINQSNIETLYNLLIIADILECTEKVQKGLFNFGQYSEIVFENHFKYHTLTELSVQLCILVCGEWYPLQALTNLADFCDYQIDYIWDNENDNDFYNFFLNPNLLDLSKREIVELGYSILKSRFESYF